MRAFGTLMALLLVVALAACKGADPTSTPTPTPSPVADESPVPLPVIPGFAPDTSVTTTAPFTPGGLSLDDILATQLPDLPPPPMPAVLIDRASDGLLPVATPLPTATVTGTPPPTATSTPRAAGAGTPQASATPKATSTLGGDPTPTEAVTRTPGPTLTPATPGPTSLTPLPTPTPTPTSAPTPTETPTIPGAGLPAGPPTPTFTPRPPEPKEWSVELSVIPVDSDVTGLFNLLLGVDARCPEAIGCTASIESLPFQTGRPLRVYMCHPRRSSQVHCASDDIAGGDLLSQSLLHPDEPQRWVLEAEYPGNLDIVFTWEPPRRGGDFTLRLRDGATDTDMDMKSGRRTLQHAISIKNKPGTRAFVIEYVPVPEV